MKDEHLSSMSLLSISCLLLVYSVMHRNIQKKRDIPTTSVEVVSMSLIGTDYSALTLNPGHTHDLEGSPFRLGLDELVTEHPSPDILVLGEVLDVLSD